MTTGGGKQSIPRDQAAAPQRDAHGYPAGVLPVRLPAKPNGAPRASVNAPNDGTGRPGHNRYPDAIRALIAGEAHTPLAEPRRPVSTWHDTPADHEIDFLASVAPAASDLRAIGHPTPRGTPAGVGRGVARPVGWLIKLPLWLVRVVFPPTIQVEDSLPVVAPPSFPQPRWDTAPIGVAPVRYDPHAAERVARRLESQRAQAQAQATNDTPRVSAAPLPERGPKRMAPESILPPAEIDADEVVADTPLDWHNLPDVAGDVDDSYAGSSVAVNTSITSVPGQAEPETPDPQPNTLVAFAHGLRRLIVGMLSMIFTLIRWTPRVLWCCTFGLVKAGYDILSEAAQTSRAPAPLKKPSLPQPHEPATHNTPVAIATSSHSAPSVAKARPVVSEPRRAPSPSASPTASKTEPPAPLIAKPPTPVPPASPAVVSSDIAPPTKRDPAEPPPVPPIFPVSRDVTDEIAAAKRSGPIVLGPSTVMPALADMYPTDHTRAPGLAPGFFTSGLGNLMLMVLGSTSCFAAGFGLSQLDKDSLVMLGVLMMIAGVGGSLLGVMLLNEWVSSLRFQIKLPVRLVVRVMGLCAAVSLLAAFAALTIPREHWPI